MRAVEEIPAGVEVTISYRSIIGTLVTMRVTMKVAVRMTITMWLTVVMVISVMPYRFGRCFREIQFTRTPLKEDFSTRAKRRKLLKEVKFSLVSGKLSNYVLMKRICIYAYIHMLLIVGAMIMKRQMTMTMKRQMTNGK